MFVISIFIRFQRQRQSTNKNALMHAVHTNLQTHIPRFIPFQLRPIRASIKEVLEEMHCCALSCLSPIMSSRGCAHINCEKGNGKTISIRAQLIWYF